MYPHDWVRAAYEKWVFPRLRNVTVRTDTGGAGGAGGVRVRTETRPKLLLVPPAFGGHNPCTTAAPPSVWCVNLTYSQWVELNLGNLSYCDSNIRWIVQPVESDGIS